MAEHVGGGGAGTTETEIMTSFRPAADGTDLVSAQSRDETTPTTINQRNEQATKKANHHHQIIIRLCHLEPLRKCLSLVHDKHQQLVVSLSTFNAVQGSHLVTKHKDSYQTFSLRRSLLLISSPHPLSWQAECSQVEEDPVVVLEERALPSSSWYYSVCLSDDDSVDCDDDDDDEDVEDGGGDGEIERGFRTLY